MLAQTEFADRFTTDFLNEADYNRDVSYIFFNDTAFKSDIDFIRVTCYVQSSNDSTFRRNKLIQKSIVNFNDKGEVTSFAKYDSDGILKDSTIILYNKKLLQTRRINFSNDNPKGTLQKILDNFVTFDSMGLLTKDSTYEKIYDDPEDKSDTGMISISVQREYFDKTGASVTFRVENSDTTIEIYQFNSKFKDTLHRSYAEGKWSSAYLKYDDSLNVVEDIDSSFYDTTRHVYTYDGKNRKTLEMSYESNKLKWKEVTVYGNGEERTITKERYGDNLEHTCQNEKTNMTVYDIHGFIVSEVEINNENGKTLTTSTTSKYEYNANGKATSDSEFYEEKSKWHYTRTLKVFYWKYDNRGNIIEESKDGGEGTGQDNRTVTTYNDKNKVLEKDEFTSCSDKPYRTETNIYYPDGGTLYKNIISTDADKTTLTFGKNSRMIEQFVQLGKTYYRTIFEYKE